MEANTVTTHLINKGAIMLFSSLFLLLPSVLALYGSSSKVKTLTSTNFDKLVLKDAVNWKIVLNLIRRDCF